LASDLCDRAIALDGNDAVVLAIAAMERHNLQNDGEAALAMAERAVALTPNSYEVLKLAALIQRQRGRADSAIGLFERCYQLGPNSPDSAIFVENIGCCHLDRGRYTEAAEWIRRALGMGASWDLALVNLVVADAMQGEIEEAQATLERFLRVRPGATIQRVMERLPPGTRQSVEHVWPEGLRRAGLPEA
jgi:tetratricopeptide (TPR) repeat protein